MDFTWDPSGTAQQIAWAQQAAASCTYPISDLTASATVVWVDVMPEHADSTHPYMVTQPEGDDFLISVVKWADDPKAPGVQGLPDPAADVEDFYKASFIHELGHVAADSTFNPGGTDTDSRVGEVCALFWTAKVGGNGRRYGTFADWDDSTLTWAQEIREAVAECFKLAFCPTPTVYQNRTIWNIDESNWAAFLGFIGDTTEIITDWTLTVPYQQQGPATYSLEITGQTEDFAGTGSIITYDEYYVALRLPAITVPAGATDLGFFVWSDSEQPDIPDDATYGFGYGLVVLEDLVGWTPGVPQSFPDLTDADPGSFQWAEAALWNFENPDADDDDPLLVNPYGPSYAGPVIEGPGVAGNGTNFNTVPVYPGDSIPAGSLTEDDIEFTLQLAPSGEITLGELADLTFAHKYQITVAASAAYPFKPLVGKIAVGAQLRGAVDLVVAAAGRLPIAKSALIGLETDAQAKVAQSTLPRGITPGKYTLRGALDT